MKSFNEIYEKIHKESYEELEKIRKDRAKKSKIFLVIAIIAFVIVSSFTKGYFAFIFVVFMIVLIIGISINKSKFLGLSLLNGNYHNFQTRLAYKLLMTSLGLESILNFHQYS